jgi:hypothetical protein
MLGWKVVAIYPMPLVAEAAFVRVRVAVGPGSGSADGAVVFGFEDLLKNRLGSGL